MSTATTESITLDRQQHIETFDGLIVYGTERLGWWVTNEAGEMLAHLIEAGLDALGALDRYRQQCREAERMASA